MIDLRWTELSLGLSLLFNISFFLYVFIYFKRCVYQPVWRRSDPILGLVFFSLFLIIFVSSNSGSDWYHYQDMVWNYDLSPGAVNHGEPVYYYLIKFINRNYFLFRLIVWGTAFWLTVFFFKRLGINVNVAIFFIIASFLITYNYARATLAMAFYFVGLTYFIKPTNGSIIRGLILAVFFFLCAFTFHHSIIVLILLTVVVYLPVNKPAFVIVSVLALPLLGSFLHGKFGLVELMENDYFLNKMNGFEAKESPEATVFGVVQMIINYTAFFVPVLFDTVILAKNIKIVDLSIIRLHRLMIIVVLLSLSFLFMGLQSNAFFYRILYMAMIPLVAITVYLYENGLIRLRIYCFIVLSGVLANAYSLLYGLYKVF